jgi:hypothetical protein
MQTPIAARHTRMGDRPYTAPGFDACPTQPIPWRGVPARYGVSRSDVGCWPSGVHAVVVTADSGELYPGDIKSVLLTGEQIQTRTAELPGKSLDGTTSDFRHAPWV